LFVLSILEIDWDLNVKFDIWLLLYNYNVVKYWLFDVDLE